MKKFLNFFDLKKRIPVTHWILLFLLLLLITVGVMPNYLSGQWSWMQAAKIPKIQYLSNLTKTGLNLAHWKTVGKTEALISENTWLEQAIEQKDTLASLLIRPQDYYRDKPEVEWSDLESLAKWKTDSHTQLNFSSSSPSYSVTAHFFRAWNQRTYAVIQWYAWPGGGNYAPSRWFWQDQWAQLQGKRSPWVAISIQVAIDPSKELETLQLLAKALAQDVQTALEQQVFSRLKET